MAYAIGKRVGGAVVRNRLRRRLRAIVGELGRLVHPGAYLIAAAPEATALPYGDLRALVSDALTTVSAAARPVAGPAR
ncbi:MAG: Ribonuclease [Actinomycetota bacterium]|nr:Ribonuclease [Actinomycetota bacterium]